MQTFIMSEIFRNDLRDRLEAFRKKAVRVGKQNSNLVFRIGRKSQPIFYSKPYISKFVELQVPM